MSDELSLTKLLTCLNWSRGLKQRILFGTKNNEQYLKQVKTEMEKIQSQRNFDLIMEKMRNGKKKCMKKFINGLILISFLDKINKLLSKFYDDNLNPLPYPHPFDLQHLDCPNQSMVARIPYY